MNIIFFFNHLIISLLPPLLLSDSKISMSLLVFFAKCSVVSNVFSSRSVITNVAIIVAMPSTAANMPTILLSLRGQQQKQSENSQQRHRAIVDIIISQRMYCAAAMCSESLIDCCENIFSMIWRISFCFFFCRLCLVF